MTLRQRLSAGYKAFRESGKAQAATKEAASYYGSTGITIDQDEHHYRRITQARRDLPAMKQEKAINLSYMAYEKNPLAQRLIKAPIEAISSAGLDFKAGDDRIYELWEEWFDDPLDGFKNSLFGLVGRSLLIDAELSGEAVWPFVAREHTGMLDIAYIDPENIEAVRMLPGNARVSDEIILKSHVMPDEQQRILKVARRSLDRKKFEGNTFYFPINSSVNSTRGRPSLFALIDWLDIYDQALFGDSERWAALRSVLWDIEMKGVSDEKALIAFTQMHFPNGTVTGSRAIAHNETVSIKATTPDLKANDASELSNLLRRYIASGRGIPDFMLGFSGDVGSASIREMSIPMVWMIEQTQRFVQHVIVYVFNCVLLKAIEHHRQLDSGVMNESVDLSFEVKTRSVFPRDMVQLTSTFVQAVAGAQAAEEAGYLSRATCQEIVLNAAGQLGIEKNLDDEQEAIAAEKKQRDEEEADEFEVEDEDENEDDDNALGKEQQKDLTGMAGETMPQNKRLVQMSYVPEAYRNGRHKKFQDAWNKRKNGVKV